MASQYTVARDARAKAEKHKIDPSYSPTDVFAYESPSEGAAKQLMPQSDDEDLGISKKGKT